MPPNASRSTSVRSETVAREIEYYVHGSQHRALASRLSAGIDRRCNLGQCTHGQADERPRHQENGPVIA